MPVNFLSETEMAGAKVSKDQLQIICHRYYFASRFVSGKEVLEVGPGPGLGLGYLSRSAKQVVGGDITGQSLRYAQEYYRDRAKIELVLMDAHKLPFRDSCFDVIVALGVIIYLDVAIFLDECYRSLKREGVLIINTPNRDIPNFRGSRLSRDYFSVPELFSLLDQHHFNTEFFGAFPVVRGLGGVARQRFLKIMTEQVGKTFDLLPKGGEVKEFLSRSLLYNTVLKKELTDEDVKICKDVRLMPLNCGLPNNQYRIIYAVASARKPEISQ